MTDPVANEVRPSSDADSLRGILRELEDLSSADLPQKEFLTKLLAALVDAVAVAGSVWWIDPNRSLSCVTQYRLDEIRLADSLEATRHHQVLLTGAFQSEKPSYHHLPHLGSAADGVYFVPIQLKGRRVGVIDLFVRRGGPAHEDHAALALLFEAGSLVTRYLERLNEALHAEDPLHFFDLCGRFLDELHGANTGNDVAHVAVNELRTLFVLDRVSLYEERGKQFRLTAVSGQVLPDRRANQVRAMGALVQSVSRFDEPFVYEGRMEEMPALIAEPLGRYLEEAQSRMVMIRPLRLNMHSPAAGRARAPARSAPQAVLVFEQFADSRPKPALLRHGERLSRQVGLSLRNARRYERLLLVPGLWHVSRFVAWLTRRRIAWMAGIALMLLTAGLLLCVVPGEYRVEGKGRLMPSVRHHVFAPWDGEIVECFVSGGEDVRPGDVLFRVESPSLRSDLLLAQSQLNEKRKLLTAIEVEQHSSADRATRENSLRLQAQWESTRIEIESLRARVDLLGRQVEDLTVKSPGAGSVALLSATDKLLGRPVHRGEHLLDVMDRHGDWRLELAVPERLSLPVVQAIESSDRLPVDFRLLAAPAQTHSAQLAFIDDQTRPTTHGDSVLHVFADLDEKSLPHLHIGADVVARIDCGSRPLMQIYFGELIDFIRRRLWL